MKEASGELSMTAVAVVAIAAVGVLFTTVIWPQIKTNINRNTYCSQTIKCDDPANNTDKTQKCYYCKSENGTCTGNDLGEVRCPVQK